MAEEKVALEKRMSPVGIVGPYAKVQTPDETYKNYQIKLSWLPESDGYEWAQALVAEGEAMIEAEIEKARKAFKPKPKPGGKGKMTVFEEKRASTPWTVDDETGVITINFKKDSEYTKTVGDKKITSPMSLLVVDAKRNKLPTDVDLKIGEGSTAKVSFTMVGFNKGIGASCSIRLLGVQILTIVEWVGGDSAESLGFEEEDGFDSTAASDEDAGEASEAGIDAEETPADEEPNEEEAAAAAEQAELEEQEKKAAALAAKKQAAAKKPAPAPAKPAPAAKGKPAPAPVKPAPAAKAAPKAAPAAAKGKPAPKAAPVDGEDNGDF